MAVGPICIPTIREDVVRLRQADLVREAAEHELELLARDQDGRRRHAPAATRVSTRRHLPLRPVRTH